MSWLVWVDANPYFFSHFPPPAFPCHIKTSVFPALIRTSDPLIHKTLSHLGTVQMQPKVGALYYLLTVPCEYLRRAQRGSIMPQNGKGNASTLIESWEPPKALRSGQTPFFPVVHHW